MSKLTDTQLVVLAHAAKRKNGAILPLPTSVKLNKAAAERVLKSLVKRGLAEERRAAPRQKVWREQGGQPMALFISKTGLAVIGVDLEEGEESGQRTNPSHTEDNAEPAPKASSKQDTLLGLLRRKGGATIDELIAASDWQAHSVRGFLSGTVKKKLGLPLVSERAQNGPRRYRIAARADSGTA